MRLLLDSLLLAILGTAPPPADTPVSYTTTTATETATSSSDGHSTTSSTSSTSEIEISWQETQDLNPFSTADHYYEVWHNGDFLTALDDNSITLSIRNYPTLEAGCIQIRTVIGEAQSGLSDETCYEIATLRKARADKAKTNKANTRKNNTSKKSKKAKERKRAKQKKRKKVET